ncbi:MAG TPA: 2OG-Fe(II) oxygenase [Haliangiales bacterium]|nr:2OG-Fe(II) oxygenase [Haliangiales bacterium]
MRSNPATAIVCLPLLDAGECDAWLAHLQGCDWQDARVASPAYGSSVERVIRSTATTECRDPERMARIVDWIAELNRGLFRFDLDGPSPSDPLLAMRYREGDHFDWHIDNSIEAVATRKLSFTLQLTPPDEYDGGDLEFAMYAASYGGTAPFAGYTRDVRRRGAITVFPAFHLHRVSPVTRGTRLALVGWLHGPRFR